MPALGRAACRQKPSPNRAVAGLAVTAFAARNATNRQANKVKPSRMGTGTAALHDVSLGRTTPMMPQHG